MLRRQDWFTGPIDGVVFALIMALAAFLGRENPQFVYPQILHCFLALLIYNFVNFSFLPRILEHGRRAAFSAAANILLLTLVLHYSGGSESYFWALYLLPVLSGCLSLRRPGIILTASTVIGALTLFYLGAVRRGQWALLLEFAIKAATIAASTIAVMSVALRERFAQRTLEEEQARIAQERSAAQENLQRMDRLATLGTLTAGVAHELSTPLTTILGYAQLVQRPDFPQAEFQKLGGRIEASALRCRQIIQDMLAFSRQKKAQRRKHDVRVLLKECVELKRCDWVSSHFTVEEDYDPNLPELLLSGAEFQQVIFNLLTNAFQALRAAGTAPGRIRVTARSVAKEAVVTVEDNGPGIPPEILEKIWEAFFTTKPEGEGTGLGLAISKRIVEAQGGRIDVDTAPGRGTTFRISLPLEGEASAQEGSPGRPDAPGEALIVDDDRAVREIVARLLRPYGLAVAQGGSFNEAADYLRARRPRLFLMDLHMPGMTAIEFFREMDRDGLLRNQTLAVVSGTPPGEALEAYLRDKGYPYLSKPFELEPFSALMDRLLRGGQSS